MTQPSLAYTRNQTSIRVKGALLLDPDDNQKHSNKSCLSENWLRVIKWGV